MTFLIQYREKQMTLKSCQLRVTLHQFSERAKELHEAPLISKNLFCDTKMARPSVKVSLETAVFSYLYYSAYMSDGELILRS